MKNVADVYPLSPMQDSMLLHAISAARNDTLLNQFCYRIEGPLEVEALHSAWRQLLARHTALRTAFVWENLKQPLQVVREQLDLPLAELDWSALDADGQADALRRFLADERDKPFDPTRAPLLKLTLMRLAAQRHYFVWTSHHLLLDRWCLATVYQELAECYDAARAGLAPRLAPARPFRDYINWLAQQPAAAAESFWRGQLAGLCQATRLTRPDPGRTSPQTAAALLPAATAEALRGWSTRHAVTLSTLLQTALALLLNRCSGQQDVVFGVTVSGRPVTLAGVDAMLGSFINNLPVRVRLGADTPILACMKQLQSVQQRRGAFEHVALADLHRWCELPARQHLFDALLVWLAPPGKVVPTGLTLTPLPGELSTGFPLTLSVAEQADGWHLGIALKAGFDTVVPPAELLAQLIESCQALADSAPPALLGKLPGFRGEQALAPLQQPPVPASPVLRDAGSGAAGSGGRETFEEDYLRDMLVSEWRDLLDIEQPGSDDNFFDLGGESLLAAKLHARIETNVRKCIPLLALFRAPTIRDMIAVIRSEDWPVHTQVAVPIRAKGTLAPLFCVASPEVNTLGYTLLHRHLDTQRPVYVLQTPPDSEQIRALSPAELPPLASDYLAALREVQPRGPYHFVARCTGAHLAVEMARQLRAAGETVAFLGIINTWSYHTVSRLYYLHRFINVLAYYAGRLRGLARMPPRDALAELKRVAGIGGPAPAAQAGAPRDTSASPTAPASLQVGWADQARSGEKYVGEITVFRTARQKLWRINDAALGWGMEAEAVRVVRLAGERPKSLLREPYIRGLAAGIEAGIAGSPPAAPAQSAPGTDIATAARPRQASQTRTKATS